MAVEKKYEFDGPKGKVSLLDLFEGRRQLVLYRAFFEPGVFGWPAHACRGRADQVAHLAHLNARDTTLAYLTRAAGGHRVFVIAGPMQRFCESSVSWIGARWLSSPIFGHSGVGFPIDCPRT